MHIRCSFGNYKNNILISNPRKTFLFLADFSLFFPSGSRFQNIILLEIQFVRKVENN